MDTLIHLLPLSYTDSVVALGALVLGVVSGVVGTFAVLRQRSLVGDALAHAALPGVCAAFLLTGLKDPAALLAGAACAGIVAAVLIVGVERAGRLRPDAAIGVVLSSLFSLGIVLLTAISNRNDADQAGLERYLFGQAAGLSERDVEVTLLLGIAALVVVAVGFRAFKATLFDSAFAGAAGLPVRLMELTMTALLVVAVVVGIRMVGAILMVAMLIAPPVAARQLTDRLSVLIPLAGAVGAGVGVAGALLSAGAQVPTGPVIVLVGFTIVLASLAFSPRRGVVWRARRLATDRRRALAEGVLVDVHSSLRERDTVSEDELAELGARPRRVLSRGLRALRTGGPSGEALITGDRSAISLTPAGVDAVHELDERRALWGAWLEHGARLELGDAREADPRDLRGSLGEDAVRRLHDLDARGATA